MCASRVSMGTMLRVRADECYVAVGASDDDKTQRSLPTRLPLRCYV